LRCDDGDGGVGICVGGRTIDSCVVVGVTVARRVGGEVTEVGAVVVTDVF